MSRTIHFIRKYTKQKKKTHFPKPIKMINEWAILKTIQLPQNA